MSLSIFPRMTACLLLSAVLLSALPGCTKRIDTSTTDKYYKTLTEVMKSLPDSKKREFDEGMSMLWFYSESDEATNAMINGKSGAELLALIEETKAALPKLDTSSKEAYESSLAKIKAGLPPSKVNDFNLPRMDIQSVFAIIRSVTNGRDNVSFAIHTGRAFRFVHGQEIRVFYSNLYVSQNVHLFLRLVDGIENMLSDFCFTLQFTCPLRAYIRSMVVCRSIGWVWCNVC